jgi:CDP-6-deoxy-D-xylo-4-hexulose-3-dehydrase
MSRKEKILNFLLSLENEENLFIPQFCHNLKDVKNKVYYGGPSYTKEEIVEAIDTLLFGKWLASGENVAKFEKEFSKKINQKYSVMVNSGSSANLVMIAALKKHLNWKDEDEILISVVGFPTTLNPVIQNNLKPVFVDIEFETLNFDLNQLEAKITKNTKAIFISPVLGNPPDFDKLIEISKKHNIHLILDGCDSFGSKWDGKHLNEYCIASSCSFYPAHHLTTGEGGMVSSDIEEVVNLARSFAWWGRDCYCIGSCNLLKNGSCNQRFSNWIKEIPYNIDHKYFFTQIGYNLKPLDLQGAIGLVQLKKMQEFHLKRVSNKDKIQNILSRLDGLKFPSFFPKADISWFGVPIICSDYLSKNKLVNYLEENGIQTRNYFAGNILVHPAYKHLENWESYTNANAVLEKVFFVGCSPTISESNIEYLASVIDRYDTKD